MRRGRSPVTEFFGPRARRAAYSRRRTRSANTCAVCTAQRFPERPIQRLRLRLSTSGCDLCLTATSLASTAAAGVRQKLGLARHGFNALGELALGADWTVIHLRALDYAPPIGQPARRAAGGFDTLPRLLRAHPARGCAKASRAGLPHDLAALREAGPNAVQPANRPRLR